MLLQEVEQLPSLFAVKPWKQGLGATVRFFLNKPYMSGTSGSGTGSEEEGVLVSVGLVKDGVTADQNLGVENHLTTAQCLNTTKLWSKSRLAWVEGSR